MTSGGVEGRQGGGGGCGSQYLGGQTILRDAVFQSREGAFLSEQEMIGNLLNPTEVFLFQMTSSRSRSWVCCWTSDCQ
ncbi:hypothetical protein J4Q44_G00087690 [Coregonus suidteri]|uniref:Uncharacterized protein n=1 Tax=Coregonus suidteri TaxID=861788 RepID=A0AAN8LZH1_9TELE